MVVVATTKVHIFKQITTFCSMFRYIPRLLLLPQRYIFSSKSQHRASGCDQARRCCCYHKGTYFQANHNRFSVCVTWRFVVVATTKVHIFKQITTIYTIAKVLVKLLLLPQRYIFSSKSQRIFLSLYLPYCCCCYHKGTYFQANHNLLGCVFTSIFVVVATTKVHIFKQITTQQKQLMQLSELLLLPQRYIFSSKSQPRRNRGYRGRCCCCYHKGTYFQANHNWDSIS